MVALFLVCYFLLTLVLGWKINKINHKLRSDLIKASEELQVSIDQKEAMACKLAKQHASKKRGKAKAEALEALIKGKQELTKLLEEQLGIAQSTDRGLRETNLRLANQITEVNDTLARMREEL
jgi:septal ring factor EnvC (AmiA/AmiB activator)